MSKAIVTLKYQKLHSFLGFGVMFGVPWPQMNDGLRYEESANFSSSQQAETILQYYTSRYESSASKEGWRQRILNGQIEMDGQVVTSPEALIRHNAALVYRRAPWQEPSAPFRLEILYEDEHLLAVSKPSGLQVLPGGLFQQRTVLSQLQWRARDLAEENHPTPVHRLGRGTSGVLLCAKSDQARNVIGSKLAAGTLQSESQGRISKVYRALVCGILKDDEVSVDQAIGRVRYPGVRGGLYMAVAKGKQSYSKVTTLKRITEENKTIVEVEILSGRAHQIRIHLASIGHPLAGDPLYIEGGKPSMEAVKTTDQAGIIAQDGGYERPQNPLPGDCGYLLHAHRLSFHHPVTNEYLEIAAPLPPELIL